MVDFTIEEMVWATVRQRQDEARRLRPHTDAKSQSQLDTSSQAERGHCKPSVVKRCAAGLGPRSLRAH